MKTVTLVALLMSVLVLGTNAAAQEMRSSFDGSPASQASEGPLELHPGLIPSPAAVRMKNFLATQPAATDKSSLKQLIDGISIKEMAGSVVSPKASSLVIPLTSAVAATKAVQIHVSIAAQRLSIMAPGKNMTNVPIASSGHMKGAVPTALGCFQATSTDPNHHSKRFHNAPMGKTIFFNKGEALHEGDPYKRSHGCVHVQPAVEAQIYAIVSAHGVANTSICID